MICKGLAPNIDNACHTLVLGSMPGIQSLAEQQYYAHPQNRFWRMMAQLLNEELPVSYDGKLSMLLLHHIALWDSIGACEREGSLDSTIKKEQGNDFTALLVRYPKIQTVCFNGAKSAAAFKRFNQPLLARHGLAFFALPSTSPANARFRMADLLAAWGKAIAPKARCLK